jgi:hypothetical protein
MFKVIRELILETNMSAYEYLENQKDPQEKDQDQNKIY